MLANTREHKQRFDLEHAQMQAHVIIVQTQITQKHIQTQVTLKRIQMSHTHTHTNHTEAHSDASTRRKRSDASHTEAHSDAYTDHTEAHSDASTRRKRSDASHTEAHSDAYTNHTEAHSDAYANTFRLVLVVARRSVVCSLLFDVQTQTRSDANTSRLVLCVIRLMLSCFPPLSCRYTAPPPASGTSKKILKRPPQSHLRTAQYAGLLKEAAPAFCFSPASAGGL